MNLSHETIKAKEIKIVPLKDITLNPKNRNKHPQEQVDAIVKILRYQGFRRPVTISNRSGLLVCGEGRYLAAKKLGMTAIPATYQDYENEDQEYADGIADNALDKRAELDLAAINLDLADLGPDFDLDVLGLPNFALEPAEKFINEALDNEDDDFKTPEGVYKLVFISESELEIEDLIKLIGVKKIKKYRDGKLYSARWPEKNE